MGVVFSMKYSDGKYCSWNFVILFWNWLVVCCSCGVACTSCYVCARTFSRYFMCIKQFISTASRMFVTGVSSSVYEGTKLQADEETYRILQQWGWKSILGAIWLWDIFSAIICCFLIWRDRIILYFPKRCLMDFGGWSYLQWGL